MTTRTYHTGPLWSHGSNWSIAHFNTGGSPNCMVINAGGWIDAGYSLSHPLCIAMYVTNYIAHIRRSCDMRCTKYLLVRRARSNNHHNREVTYQKDFFEVLVIFSAQGDGKKLRPIVCSVAKENVSRMIFAVQVVLLWDSVQMPGWVTALKLTNVYYKNRACLETGPVLTQGWTKLLINKYLGF